MTPEHLQGNRHTLAHLLAASVRALYPGAQNAIGPAIDNGFYQDFEIPVAISDADLPKIEKKMREILKTWKTSEKREVTVEEAKKEFAWNIYKSQLIEEFAEGGKTLTFYTLGDFVDLCKGGHSENPVKDVSPDSFKLQRVAGAYWKNDAKNKMLTRIYGLAFATKADLDAYVTQLEEAKKRDHRKIGKELKLFVFSELVGPGLPLWTPKGTIIRELLNDFVWSLRKPRGYQKVTIPHITKKDLYETSGHWAKYADDLFKIKTREKHIYAMKPMNCPHHTQIYDSEQRSYRDLPQRYCETTMVYRDEQSGELSGLSRVISITQDDSHVFCRLSQIKQEVESVWQIVENFYAPFGFNLTPRLSIRDMKTPEKYLGVASNWDIAEQTLKGIIEAHTAKWIDGTGEAAFYGPKIDFMAHDSIGREWQVATIQLDFVQPERFGLVCMNEKSEKEPIVMFHVAIMGSIERFMAIIIEHFAGAFPVWLSPVQVAIVPVKEVHNEYAEMISKALSEKGVRVEIHSENDSIGKRINGAKAKKVPYVIVVGDKEKEAGVLTVETRAEKIEGITTEKFVEKIEKEIAERTLN